MGQPEGGTGAPLPVVPPVIFTQQARTEVIAAQDWYEEQVTGLGAQGRPSADGPAQYGDDPTSERLR
jgi:hypothetical protein